MPEPFRNMNRRLSLLALIAVISSGTAFAGITRWVDSEGKVHYSDQPPPAGAKAEKQIETPPPAPAQSKESPSKSLADKEMEFRKRQQEKADAQSKKDKEAADAKIKKQNCDNAQATLRNLESGVRTFSVNEKGERVYMDDTARQNAIAEAKKAADSWCK